MKKLLCAALSALLLALTACSGAEGSGQPESGINSSAEISSMPAEDISQETSSAPAVSSEPPKPYVPPVLTSVRSAVAVYCVEDDELLYGENIDARLAPASITKVMTSAVALRCVSPDEVFTAGSEQDFVDPESSIAYVLPGHSLTLHDLILGMMLPSGNDAAYCVAVNTARRVRGQELGDAEAVGYFAYLMNETAKELGMTGTHFANPDGWDNDEHYTTVSDLIRLTKYAITVPEIREAAATTKVDVNYVSGETNTWYNSNPLLHPDGEYYCPYATGLKTGSTDNAGRCQIATFSLNSKTYIIIAMGYESIEDRCRDIMALFNGIAR